MLKLDFDHLGIIVKSIEKEIPTYESLGYIVESEIFSDENQQMRGVFLTSPFAPRVELIEDLSDSKALTKILNSNCGKIYHIAFKVDNLENKLNEILKQTNGRILSPIKKAQYYNKVCFIFLSNTQIIELVEYKC